MAKKILIVDDNDVNRDIVKRALSRGSYELFEARDGNEAVSKSQEIIPDMLILDIMMPGMNGYEVCKVIRNSESTKDAYIIFLSARSGGVVERTAKAHGGDEYMEKPISPKNLRQRVATILG